MATFVNTHRAVLTELSGRAIRDSVKLLRSEDRLTIAMRQALRNGVRIDDLSEMTGLTPSEIRRRTGRELAILEDLEALVG
jgi:hypothetical protein